MSCMSVNQYLQRIPVSPQVRIFTDNGIGLRHTYGLVTNVGHAALSRPLLLDVCPRLRDQLSFLKKLRYSTGKPNCCGATDLAKTEY